MCGIAGIINKEIQDKDEVIRNMTGCILHRGPDEDGFYVDEQVGLGMRRLSIIDLAGGKQPVSSADGRHMIFFNGEIYNYKELKKKHLDDYEFKTESDTEVVLAMYLKFGAESLKQLRGMFAFCIYDTQDKIIFLARDFFGIKPLYYYAPDSNSSGVVAFASEIKSFFEVPGFKPEVNDAAVFNYLSYQYNPLEETFFKRVYKLPPGHYMKIDLKVKESNIKKYWNFSLVPDATLDEKDLGDRVLKTMEDSVAHHMIADVPVGSFLSGGIDSSIIATLMQKIRGTDKIKTFTVGFDTLTEGREARETAEPLGTEHIEISVGQEEYFRALPKALWHFDEPVADPSAIGLYFLAEEARKHVKVVLSGEGADELFGGYNIYLEPFSRRKIAWLPEVLLRWVIKLPFEFRGQNYARRASRRLEEWYIGNASIFNANEAKEIWKGAEQERFSLRGLYKESENLSDSAKMQYIDVHTWLIGDILAKADKMTMAHSLELRVPFLDKDVAKLASTLPDKLKWKGGATKYILREAFKSVLPETTRTRKKLGFPTPVRDWLKNEMDKIRKVIIENRYVKEHMDTEIINHLMREHLSGKRDNSRKIYLLLALAIWYNVYFTEQQR
ncbi:MAG: asparagine synthase (glutamine-hydrolyzing) [bacterium]|nr:asparagine synthase (glutamine-hydrolyzing) [bacterium]